MSKTIAIIIPLLLLLCYRGHSQTSEVSFALDTPGSRHAAYLQLNRQIYARHEDPGSGKLNDLEDKVQATSKELHKMIAKEIELALAGRKPSSEAVISAISNLQGEITLSTGGLEYTNTPFANLFVLNGIHSVAVAYVVMRGGDAIPDTQPYLEFYDKTSGVWQEKASAPTLSDFERCTFSVARLSSGVPGEDWFLAWGGPFGSSHASINLRLYAFDGAAVRTIWRRDSLNGGRITTTADTITIDYFGADDLSIEKHEVFHITANGPELITESSKQW